MTRHSTTIVVLPFLQLLLVPPAASAQVPLDTARQLAAVAREATRIGTAEGETIWPRFRPQAIPLSFVLPSRGDLLVGWTGALPSGYTAVPELPGAAWRDQRALGAASTATALAGRRVAQVVAVPLDPATLAAVALHEAFHVFEA